ncbi:glycoside hydrolase family 25 protein [Robertkochia sediminum]|uniref:glycoside hydrolase family 25 protein n=1 Tax=Robertkochia sediminum TaxID=2785326 RepID=UPI0019312C73|nr:GH25 family lysozyme [Robertkochia sediminum]MBL7471405.1 glycoside hydrolase family 25 protein [Robertkochia sediminum]
MSNLSYTLIDYKAIHPFRFWAIAIGLVLLIIGLAFLLRWLYGPQQNKLLGSRTASRKVLLPVIVIQVLIILGLVGLKVHDGMTLAYIAENTSISSSEYIFGIDVSHYQGRINWKEVRTSRHPIEYVFIRSTMGADGRDMHFKENWKKAKEHNYIRGAYHYYRPNENSTRQFENYRSQVALGTGDFIPILDVEKESIYGRENLVKGVLNWLKLAEEAYGVKPMIYTGLTFYQDILKDHVDDYPLWIAAYSGKHRLKNEAWTFHQFTEHVRVKGIGTTVDGNDFKGQLEDLKQMCME